MKDSFGAKEDPRFVIGLSGGIDSAVAAGLLVKAVGPEKVMGVNMPSKYNSEKTRDSAAYVAERLGIRYEVAPIEELVQANEKILNETGPHRMTETQMENVQAKIRGTSILPNLAAKYGALFTNNGNKLEVALGYATLYGDWGGAIAPIADLNKTEVVAMARYLNAEVFRDEVIPESVIPDNLWKFRKDQIQPSAELKNNQVDPMKFMYHCALLDGMTDYKKMSREDIMELYLKGELHNMIDHYLDGLTDKKKMGLDLMERWDVINPAEFVRDLEWFSDTIDRNVFKRVQAPPIIITSKSAYGYDIRESILPVERSEHYEKLKQDILKMEVYKPNEA